MQNYDYRFSGMDLNVISNLLDFSVQKRNTLIFQKPQKHLGHKFSKIGNFHANNSYIEIHTRMYLNQQENRLKYDNYEG